MITELLLRPVEVLLNQGLQQSATAAAMARELEGRTLALRVEITPFDMRLHIRDGRFRVTARGPELPDAAISGTLLSLGRLLGADPQAAIRAGVVRITGDAEIAEAFRNLLHHAKPDLEEQLSALVGETLAHEAGSAARAVNAWSERTADHITRSLGAYLTERSRLLITNAELAQFAREVDDLVNDVARIDARLQQCRRGFSPGPQAPGAATTRRG
jgi:ubiquinone biosynthesis protein UbiJ